LASSPVRVSTLIVAKTGWRIAVLECCGNEKQENKKQENKKQENKKQENKKQGNKKQGKSHWPTTSPMNTINDILTCIVPATIHNYAFGLHMVMKVSDVVT